MDWSSSGVCVYNRQSGPSPRGRPAQGQAPAPLSLVFFQARSWGFHWKTGTLPDSSCSEAVNQLVPLTPSRAVPAPAPAPSPTPALPCPTPCALGTPMWPHVPPVRRTAHRDPASSCDHRPPVWQQRGVCGRCPVPAACAEVSGPRPGTDG